MKQINLIAIIGGFASMVVPYYNPEIGHWLGIGWGLLFLSWVVQGIQNGESLFIIRSTREEDPLGFWLTTILWFLFSVVFILKPFFPAYF